MTIAEKLFVIAYLFISANLLGYGLRQQPMVSPLVVQAAPVTVAPVAPTATPVPTATPTPAKIWHGLASYYSKAGCLGCDPMFRTASGEILDDGALTVAFNKAPLNTIVLITNRDNGQQVRAKVSDRGGFERHGKLIDLTIATRDAIGCASTCKVTVEAN